MGKQRSSQNSLKHGIFAKKIPSEMEKHDLIWQTVSGTLRSGNPLEEAICAQIAHNLAQRAAIDRFAMREKEKANAALFREYQEAKRKGNTKLISSQPANDSSDQLPRIWCRTQLAELKQDIVERGVFSEQDLEKVRLIYGNKPTMLARTIRLTIESYLSRN